MVKTAKFQIIKPLDMDWKTLGGILYNLQKETRYVKNKTIALYNDWTNHCIEVHDKTGEYPKLYDEHGYKIFSSWVYDVIKNDIIFMNTSNYISTIRNICVAYDTHKKDIISGKCAVPNCNVNQPIDLHNKSIQLNADDKDYYVTLSLLSNKGKKELNLNQGRVSIVIKSGDKSRRDILDRCLSGQYKICASQITKKDNKYFLNLCFNFEEKKEDLDENRIMGIDLGVAIPVYMAYNYSNKLRNNIYDDKIIKRKIMIDKELSFQKKACIYNNDGHGRKNKMRIYSKYGNYSHNYSQTVNHKWSKYIIEQAVKNHCATIQMEDLSGINSKSKFLKSWTYYDLQTKIEYKAKEVGIVVNKIKPKYTSQRCSECGYIDKENRLEQKSFKCLKCGYTTNADFNAARNISIQNIDKIIEEQLKLSE